MVVCRKMFAADLDFIITILSDINLSHNTMVDTLSITTQEEWRKALDSLPSTPKKIPVFFFAHGSPLLALPEPEASSGAYGSTGVYAGPAGPLATFLKDFGPALLRKYKPKGIVVYSAHWETSGDRLGISP